MPTSIPVEEAQTRLRELIDHLAPGEEVVITADALPVARLVGSERRPVRPGPGLGKGSVVFMAPTFDDPIDDFDKPVE